MPTSGPGADLSPGLDRAHFIGIGGAGMSGLAKILKARGAHVSGSDAKDSTLLTALRQLGCDVHVGHAAENLTDPSCVVVSSADRKSTRLNSSHRCTSYAVFCLKTKSF